MEIRGNVFLITGGASGLGAGTARMLAQAGGTVVLADLNDAAGTALATELGGLFVHCDVSSEADAQAAVSAATQPAAARPRELRGHRARREDRRQGRRASARRVREDDQREPHRHVQHDPARGRRAMAATAPTADGERGVIVSTASVAAFDGQIGQAAYAASKAGVAGMTLPIARDLCAAASA